MNRSRAPFRLDLVAVLVTAVAALGGCSSSGHVGGATTATAPAMPSESASANSSDDAAVTAYRGMWTAFVEAAKTSDPDAPGIRRYASGNALKLIVGGLVSNRTEGKVVKGDLVLHPKVTVVSTSEETIADCIDATHWLEYKTNGELWDNKPGGRHRTTATVRHINGTWKVDSFDLQGAGTC